MKQFNVTIPIYAEDELQCKQFARDFFDLVNSMRSKGVAVTAEKLSSAIKQFGNNSLLVNFLR